MSALALKSIARKEVAQHDDYSDAWIIINNLVYDITTFLLSDEHPGSTELLLEYLGTDASSAFESCGHSMFARRMMQKFLIGQLPEGECTGTQEYIAYSKMVPISSPLVA